MELQNGLIKFKYPCAMIPKILHSLKQNKSAKHKHNQKFILHETLIDNNSELFFA